MSLIELIKSHLTIEKKDDLLSVFAETILYLVRSNTAFQYQDAIREYSVKQSPKKFRLLLTKMRYYSLDLKLFALVLSKTRDLDRATARKLKTQFSIHADDYKLVFKLFHEVDWFARALKAKSKPLKWDYLDPACIDLDFKNVYAAVHKYTKSLVWRKLRFVAKSSNLELADLDGDVMTKVVQSYYALVPTKQPLAYIQNYLKRAAHNHVINIIKSETTHKRGRLVNVGLDKNNNRQFSLLTVSQNQASLKLDADGQPVVPDAEDESNSIATFEVRFSIDELLASIRVGSKKHRFLLIMLGTEDKEFSAWLKKYGHCSAHEDNCDVQDRTTVKEFNILLAKYLNVDVIRIENFLTKVRQQLAA